MNAPHQSNQNLVWYDDLAGSYKVDSPAKLRHALEKDGILYFGKGEGTWTTIQLINQAKAANDNQPLTDRDVFGD